MADYHNRPVVAYSDDEEETRWLTHDRVFRITYFKKCVQDKDCFTISERHLRRLGDAHMHVLWMDVLSHVPKEIVREALNVVLYPMGSEPSTEYSGEGTHPSRILSPDPLELTKEGWVTADQWKGGLDQ